MNCSRFLCGVLSSFPDETTLGSELIKVKPRAGIKNVASVTKTERKRKRPYFYSLFSGKTENTVLIIALSSVPYDLILRLRIEYGLYASMAQVKIWSFDKITLLFATQLFKCFHVKNA